VEIAAVLAADLAVLTEALDDTAFDLAGCLRQLVVDIGSAVPSYVGLTFMNNEEQPASFTLLEPGTTATGVVSSVRMPLSLIVGSGPDVVLLCYAGQPGAFVDLVADLAWLSGLGLADFVLDEHLSVAFEPRIGESLLAASVINQAVGVLIGQGHTPERARSELEERANRAGIHLYAAAVLILATTSSATPN
jgi:hypothetical protein